MAGDLNRAKEMYLEAIGVEANCIEALFNLGLVNLKLNYKAEANQAFEKLHTILPSASEVSLIVYILYTLYIYIYTSLIHYKNDTRLCSIWPQSTIKMLW
jgi:intraflagellar transport protein 88